MVDKDFPPHYSKGNDPRPLSAGAAYLRLPCLAAHMPRLKVLCETDLTGGRSRSPACLSIDLSAGMNPAT